MSTSFVHGNASYRPIWLHIRGYLDSRWMTTPLWLSGSLKPFLYSSVYSCHLFLISSSSIRSLLFPSFMVLSLHEIFPWNLQFSWRDLFFSPILLFPSISLYWLKKPFLWRISWTEEPGCLQSIGSQSQTRLSNWALLENAVKSLNVLPKKMYMSFCSNFMESFRDFADFSEVFCGLRLGTSLYGHTKDN